MLKNQIIGSIACALSAFRLNSYSVNLHSALCFRKIDWHAQTSVYLWFVLALLGGDKVEEVAPVKSQFSRASLNNHSLHIPDSLAASNWRNFLCQMHFK